MKGLYYDRNGEPITQEQWGAWHEGTEYLRLRLEELGDGVSVSTVWIGLDHNFSGLGPPIIFETMVFGGPLNGSDERYSTEAEALEGHERWVERARGAS